MAEHPSVHHYRQAIRHLQRAADALSGAVARHGRSEHAGALEAAKQAAGHAGEAQSHLKEAARLHAEHERQGAGSHGPGPGVPDAGSTEHLEGRSDADADVHPS